MPCNNIVSNPFLSCVPHKKKPHPVRPLCAYQPASARLSSRHRLTHHAIKQAKQVLTRPLLRESSERPILLDHIRSTAHHHLIDQDRHLEARPCFQCRYHLVDVIIVTPNPHQHRPHQDVHLEQRGIGPTRSGWPIIAPVTSLAQGHQFRIGPRGLMRIAMSRREVNQIGLATFAKGQPALGNAALLTAIPRALDTGIAQLAPVGGIDFPVHGTAFSSRPPSLLTASTGKASASPAIQYRSSRSLANIPSPQSTA